MTDTAQQRPDALGVNLFPKSAGVVATMAGTNHDIPMVELAAWPCEVRIMLGNHPDPAAWLRAAAAAAAMDALAVEVETARIGAMA